MHSHSSPGLGAHDLTPLPQSISPPPATAKVISAPPAADVQYRSPNCTSSNSSNSSANIPTWALSERHSPQYPHSPSNQSSRSYSDSAYAAKASIPYKIHRLKTGNAKSCFNGTEKLSLVELEIGQNRTTTFRQSGSITPFTATSCCPRPLRLYSLAALSCHHTSTTTYLPGPDAYSGPTVAPRFTVLIRNFRRMPCSTR